MGDKFPQYRSAPQLEGGGCRIGLGTVQFGMSYGVTNEVGQVCLDEARAILTTASAAGVDLLDTARLYGESERVLGRVLPTGHDWRIVTKTGKYKDAVDAADAARQLEADFESSLEALGRPHRIHGLMVHNADDLLGEYGGALWSALEGLKHSGRVTRIGASVYTQAQIDALLDRFPIDLIQLPFNAVDQRLVHSGTLSELKGRGVEIHARSVYLQGLLLLSPNRLPARFGVLAPAIEGIAAAGQAAGLTQIEAMLAAVLARPEIDRLVVGATSAGEFAATLGAAARAGAEHGFDTSGFSVDDERILNPARWRGT